MSSDRILNVGIVGLEFGAEFIPIYQRHPAANLYGICQRSAEHLNQVGDQFGVEHRYTSFDEMLADPAIDVVHINTPVQSHADLTIAALRAGKHVGCTVPMATTVEDCQKIVEEAAKAGLVYMMMETVVYSREFLYIEERYRAGDLGKVQFIRAAHHQDMTGWPSYWDGLPPMHYATHVIAPALALCRHEAEWVQCLSSGTIYQRLHAAYGSPFAIESTHIRFRQSDIGAEVTRHLWSVARQYCESFDVFGSIRSFEWAQVAGDRHVVHLGEQPSRVDIPDYADRLPEAIRPFTTGGVYDADEAAHRSFIQGGGHGGSHPHLAHHLLMAVLGQEEPYPNATQAANITCAGILAHQSALQGGIRMPLPEWTWLPNNSPLTIDLDESVEPPWAGA